MSKQNVDLTDYLNLPAQESFILLSTNLELNKKIKKLKVISIVSFKPGEGKTLVAINLAIAAAKSGARVLYVDADLRKSNKQLDSNDSTKGLTDFNEETELEDVTCETGIEDLKYITAGNRIVEPVKFLYSQVFDRFLEEASHQYDLVFIDSPSMGNYSDSVIIASKVAGILIVARSQKTRYKDIERIKWQADNVGANIIGIVINRVNRRDFKSYFNLKKQ